MSSEDIKAMLVEEVEGALAEHDRHYETIRYSSALSSNIVDLLMNIPGLKITYKRPNDG